MKYPAACIVLFARAPVAGMVKTRLIPALGADGACALHLRLLQRISAVLHNNALCAVQLWVDQQPQHPAFAGFQDAVFLQQGADLGARLAHAAQQVLDTYSQVVFIGTDCPALDLVYLESALLSLNDLNEGAADVVLGPAVDGGYVLLGMRKDYPQLFADIDWGTSAVLRQTLDQCKAQQLQVKLLPELADIDRPEDLQLLGAN